MVPGQPRISLGWKDDLPPPEVLQARQTWMGQLTLPPQNAVYGEQVHAGVVAIVDASHQGRGATLRSDALPGTDGLFTATPDTPLSITTADCLPVLLTDLRGTAVAAVHAGWRGMAADILENAVRRFVETNIAPGDVLAALGPCIQQPAYEVGAEFARHFDPSSLIQLKGKLHFSLQREATLRLRRAGLVMDHIAALPHGTHRDSARFFSNRRDGGVKGLMLSTVCIAAPA